MDKFIELISEVFEMDPKEIRMDMDFREEVEDFNSLMGYSTIVMMEDEYEKEIDVDTFLSCKTVGDLYDLVK